MEDKEVYMIFGKGKSKPEGVYSRSCRDEYEFGSVGMARGANVHDTYQDTDKYKIKKYKVTYTLIDEDAQ